MKTIKININGKETEITLTKEQLKQINNQNPLQKVFDYHKTTEEEFNKLNGHLPSYLQGQILEAMMVEMYNKGEKPDWSNSNQNKYYPYFNMSDFSYGAWHCHYAYSNVPASVCFLRNEDLLEAVELYIDIYKKGQRPRSLQPFFIYSRKKVRLIRFPDRNLRTGNYF